MYGQEAILQQRRRLCGGSRAQAPSEIILWGPSPHRNFSYLLNNAHIYICSHIYMYVYNGNCRLGPPRNFSKSAPLEESFTINPAFIFTLYFSSWMKGLLLHLLSVIFHLDSFILPESSQSRLISESKRINQYPSNSLYPYVILHLNVWCWCRVCLKHGPTRPRSRGPWQNFIDFGVK